MVPILLCSIFSIAIIFERYVFLYQVSRQSRRVIDDVTLALKRGRIQEAQALCERVRSPVTQVFKAGIEAHERSRQEIREAIADAGAQEVPLLEKSLSSLATIAHVSPLLGLLGTVTGMVSVFQTIQERATAVSVVDPSLLAKGIWEALITTVAGLVVAIPSFVAYNYLVGKVQDIVLGMETAATELMNVLTQNK
ncbi:MAG: MotA/TolQ/ExbB proton channel family protein [Candidatus Omnitrophica bacterium]|nr:MotA/TolQ/ExbB proton channel family protein [Candidatus Omnitrophota bacterium]